MFLTVILFLVLLSVLVLVHEFGHFIAAKRAGVGVEEFGIGFPPRLASKQIGETTYSVNWLPIGGFVRIKGDVADENDPARLNAPDSFARMSLMKKLVIIGAGVAMNVILAAVLFSAGYMIGMPQILDGAQSGGVVEESSVRVQSVETGSSADLVGLQSGDEIVKVGDVAIDDTQDVITFAQDHANETVTLLIRRGSTELTLEPTLRQGEDGRGRLGVSLVSTGIVSYAPIPAIWIGVKTTVILLGQIILAFWHIIANLFAGEGPGDAVAGPIGIAVLTGQVASLGAIYLLQFAALLSLNLAIFNLIPFPALDGGRLMIIVLERIRGKALRQSVEGWIHQIGFFVLLLLILVITVRDVSVYFDRIVNYVQNLF